MCSLTSSELEIESLIAVPSSRSSCLILSSKVSSRFRGSVVLPRRRSIFRSGAARRILFVLLRFERLQTGSHRLPQFRPVGQILPAPPFRVAPEHGAVGNGASAVVALAHEPTEL